MPKAESHPAVKTRAAGLPGFQAWLDPGGPPSTLLPISSVGARVAFACQREGMLCASSYYRAKKFAWLICLLWGLSFFRCWHQ